MTKYLDETALHRKQLINRIAVKESTINEHLLKLILFDAESESLKKVWRSEILGHLYSLFDLTPKKGFKVTWETFFNELYVAPYEDSGDVFTPRFKFMMSMNSSQPKSRKLRTKYTSDTLPSYKSVNDWIRGVHVVFSEVLASDRFNRTRLLRAMEWKSP